MEEVASLYMNAFETENVELREKVNQLQCELDEANSRDVIF